MRATPCHASVVFLKSTDRLFKMGTGLTPAKSEISGLFPLVCLPVKKRVCPPHSSLQLFSELK